MALNISEILREAAARGASDLHISPGAPPQIRVDGTLQSLAGFPTFAASQCAELIIALLSPEQRRRLEQESGLDFSLSLDDSRYRGNVFFQRNGLEGVFRIIPTRIPTPEDIQLPAEIIQLADLSRGLVLVTGPTGSGKSTTLSCLINLINQKRRSTIITIEDPIEFVYSNRTCIVSQREIGTHAPSFSAALKYVLRQDPDVVLIGEMRDYETIAAAITVAETGHLVFATLHSSDAAQAVDRIIDVFPSRQQQQIRTQLASVLKTVIAQSLLPKRQSGGRVAAREIMHVTPAISNLIRQGRTHEIYSAIEMGAQQGMISMGRALSELVKRGLIDNLDGGELARSNPSR